MKKVISKAKAKPKANPKTTAPLKSVLKRPGSKAPASDLRVSFELDAKQDEKKRKATKDAVPQAKAKGKKVEEAPQARSADASSPSATSSKPKAVQKAKAKPAAKRVEEADAKSNNEAPKTKSPETAPKAKKPETAPKTNVTKDGPKAMSQDSENGVQAATSAENDKIRKQVLALAVAAAAKSSSKPTAAKAKASPSSGTVTPPPRWAQSVSSFSSEKTDAEAKHYKSRMKAEAHLKNLKGKNLEEAMREAEAAAELDAAGLDGFLDAMADEEGHPADLKEKLIESACKKRDQQVGGAEEEAEESCQEAEGEEEEEREVDNEVEPEEAEGEEAVEDEEEGGEDGAEGEGEEDEEGAEDGDEGEGTEDADEEDEGQEAEENDGQAGGVKKELVDATATTVSATKKIRNSTTHKVEWDRFSRQCQTSSFPCTLGPMLKRSKTDLFGLWLDSEQDWERVVVEASRYTQSRNLSRKEWVAIKAKTLMKEMPEEMWE